MHTPKRSLLVIAQPGKFAPCISYVFDLFARTHGYEWQLCAPGAEGKTADVTVEYKSSGEVGPAEQPTRCTLTIRDSYFFQEGSHRGFGSNHTPKGIEGLIKEVRDVAFNALSKRDAPNRATLDVDVVAAAFYLLSGYHDWASPVRDNDGRVLSTHVPLPAETWDMPMVNHWFRQLDELLQLLISGSEAPPQKPVAPPGQQTICLTHDVDFLRKYRTGRAARSLLKSFAAPGQIGKSFSALKKAMAGSPNDPYDSFDALYTVKERISAPSTYFFLGCGPTPGNGDYHPGDRDLRDLFTRARTFGDEIALHGSWDSIDDCKRLAAEKSAVETSARTSLCGSRQHYLRFSTPETWKCVNGAGLRYDSTGGFPDRAGFKYGWSGCFHPFDLDNLQTLPVLEIPLACMDVTLANYEKIPAELTLERLTNLLDAACDGVPGGAFVFLWHNIMGDREQYPGYWDTFEYFFSVASGSARFITLSQLCDEFEAGV